VGLVARHVEAAGIPTLCMSSALDITRAVNPPRAAFLDFPLGHTTGKPGQPELQRQILADALSSFGAMTVPGSIRILPYRWSDDEGWKDGAFAGGDDRLPRRDTPQYQDEEDRRRAEGADPPPCPVCRP
jgi:hypothetical protein